MNARAWVLSASLLLGCLPAAEPYRCDLAGGDRACDSVPGARCVSGYCAESVSISLCASGLRYTATARRPGECVSPEDAATVDASDAVVDATVDVSRLDAPEVSLPADRPTSMDLFAADAPPLLDVVDAGDVTDMDVPRGRDVPFAHDLPALIDAPDVRDTPDVRDAPVDWISPLPNERFLSGRIPVRVARRGNDDIFVRTALGFNCDRAHTVTRLVTSSVDISTSRNYLCLRLELGEDGGVWTSPWRRIVSMGRVYNQNAAPHWGRWPDFNNDGRADLLMATANAVRVFHFASNGTITGDSPVPGPSFSARAVAVAAVGDVDGDSFGDAVITWDAVPGREVFIHRGGPGGLQGPGVRLAAANAGPNLDLTLGQRIFPIGDRGPDGRTDFGVSAFGGLHVRTFGLDAQGRLLEGAPYIASDPIDAFVSDADVDGDGLPDSAFHTGTTTYLSLSSLRDNIVIPSEPNHSVDFGRVLALGSDLDNDGRSELAVLAPDSSEAVVYRWASRTLSVIDRLELPSADLVALVMPGDSNGDMADDLWAFSGINLARLRLGGFNRNVEGNLPWRGSLGVIIAGTSEIDTRGRVWGGGAPGTAPLGFVVYGYDGTRLTSQTVNDTNYGPVTAVAP